MKKTDVAIIPNKHMRITIKHIALLLTLLLNIKNSVWAQGDAKFSARLDPAKILAGDQARLFLEVQYGQATEKIQWTITKDTFNTLEIVERGKIDTQKQGDKTILRQRLLITGFDSGVYKIPPFQFTVVPNGGGSPYPILSDSFMLEVQSVAVDTNQAFKPIKNIILVKSSWIDYIWYYVAILLVLLAAFVGVFYWGKSKKKEAPAPKIPAKPLQDLMLDMLSQLEAKQLWQKGQVKEYYIELTDIVRSYIEKRFKTPAMELTTDELLDKARQHKELITYVDLLKTILQTADLAKFAKSQPLPQEHFDAMEYAKKLIDTSRPQLPNTPTEQKI